MVKCRSLGVGSNSVTAYALNSVSIDFEKASYMHISSTDEVVTKLIISYSYHTSDAYGKERILILYFT